MVVFTLAILYALSLLSLKPKSFYLGSKTQTYGIILAVLAWLYIGTRPLWAYTDTYLYTLMFRLAQSGEWSSLAGPESEWFWEWLEYLCIKTTDASGWLTVIALGYVGGMSLAVWKWFRNHFTLAIFFLFTAFSFWGYGTNGIRNGMATSLMMLALAFVKPEYKKNWIYLCPSIALAILSCGTHNSLYLVAVAAIVAFLCPSRKRIFWIWGVCLIASPFITQFSVSILGSIIDDHRFSYYGTAEISSKFSRSGWRWDFIIYSAMPIVLGYYVIIKKKFYDWTYIFLLNIYMYANSFWLLINEVAYSNRFAYLSWFLYPIVLLMPIVKFRLWKNQSVIAGLILLANIAFTLIF